MSSPQQDDEKRCRFTSERPCPVHGGRRPYDERRRVVFCGRCGFEHCVEGTAVVDLNFAKFVAKWRSEYPCTLPAGALLSLAEECDVHLVGETTKARQTSLGKLLAAHIGVVIEHEGVRLTIQRGPFLSGKQFYEAQNVHY